jgi:hypothetical protein
MPKESTHLQSFPQTTRRLCAAVQHTVRQLAAVSSQSCIVPGQQLLWLHLIRATRQLTLRFAAEPLSQPQCLQAASQVALHRASQCNMGI